MTRFPLFDCRACVERMSELMDGELPPVARFVTRVHARFCRDCRLHREQLRATVSVLRAQREAASGLSADAKRELLERLGAARGGGGGGSG